MSYKNVLGRCELALFNKGWQSKAYWKGNTSSPKYVGTIKKEEVGSLKLPYDGVELGNVENSD